MFYKETKEMKMIVDKDFFWLFDKASRASFVWGKDQSDDPKFDPFGPEKMSILLDESYIFNEEEAKKLVNIADRNEYIVEDSQCVSSLSMVHLDYIGQKITPEAEKLFSFFDNLGVFVSWVCHGNVSMRDALALSSRKISNVQIITSAVDGLKDSIDTCISNGLMPEVILESPVDEEDKLLEFISECPPLVFVTIYVDSSEAEKLNEKITAKGIVFKNAKTGAEDDGSLFSCIVDFTRGKVYPSKGDEEHSVSISNIESIDDFWKSQEFVTVRQNKLS